MDYVQKCSHNKSFYFWENPLFKWPALYISYTKIFNSKFILRWRMNKSKIAPYWLQGQGSCYLKWLQTIDKALLIHHRLDCESFFKQTPSDRYVQMLEPTTLYLFRRLENEEISSDNYEIRRFLRYLIEKTLINKKERILDSIFKPAKVRYNKLLEERPGLVLRTPSNIIASYLGVTPETLSRIKAKNN